MLLNSGEGNDASLAGRTSRNTAHSAASIAIGRIFLWLVLLGVIDREGSVTDRQDNCRPGSTAWKGADLRGYFSP
jgi:hypothetical protein